MTHFIIGARPTCVPPELLALAPDARVTFKYLIGRGRGGTTNAREFKDEICAIMARQSEGYFTLREAGQVLADSRPGLDALRAVKRFRLGHAKGHLPIHSHADRMAMEVGDVIYESLDLLEVSELDTWLRKSAGYGFPIAASITKRTPTSVSSMPIEQSADAHHLNEFWPAIPPPRVEEQVLPALKTADIARCFDGLWKDQKRWMKPLGDKPVWLKGCVVGSGQRGGTQTSWNPILLGGALVRRQCCSARSVRAKFQSVSMLKPWLELWKDYEAEFLNTQSNGD